MNIAMFCFFNETATTQIYTYLHTLSLHDALPICLRRTLNPGVPLPAPVSAPRTPDTEGAAALHRLVLASLDDDQAVDTISIPLAGKSSIADHMEIGRAHV